MKMNTKRECVLYCTYEFKLFGTLLHFRLFLMENNRFELHFGVVVASRVAVSIIF